MAELPTGTVTLLLTDIEGSTQLLEAEQESYRLALARHNALLTEQIEHHDGILVRSRGEGDSVFAVFVHAADALAAACEIQRALHREPWPIRTPLRIRIALDTGEVDLFDGDYVGLAIHRCARLRAIAHGGQVLLSESTHNLIGDMLPTGIRLLDLGMHWLRGLSLPERVFQVADPELPYVFPPLEAVGATQGSLPALTTTLVGRRSEIAGLMQLLTHDGVRLVTLTGPGGVGKTRLAIEVARAIAAEGQIAVAFVELAPLADPVLVPHAIASAVGVQQRADRPLLETLGEVLRTARLLLVLDNCEHLVAACAAAAQVLRGACPEVRILTTSRAPLGVSGEVTWSVPLLAVSALDAPGQDSTVPGDAVQLFIERARLRQTSFSLSSENSDTVVEICRRLEGLPLAIELAAARILLLPLDAMLARLDRRLSLLVGGPRDVPARHQTMRSTIAWSYDLLSTLEQAMFRRLGIFVGSFSLEAAEAVCAPLLSVARHNAAGANGAMPMATASVAHVLDALESLLAKNLLGQERTSGEPRFTMLETIREYAREELECAGELDDTRNRCASFFLLLAEEAAHRVIGRDQMVWLARLDAELDHLRAVLGWSRDRQISAEIGLRLAGALVLYWELRGFTIEAHGWLTALFTLPEAAERSVPRARALYAAAFIASMRMDFSEQRRLAQESASILEESGHLQEAGRSLAVCGIGETRLGNITVARDLLERSVEIAREHGDDWGLAFALGQLGSVAFLEGNYSAARHFRGEAVAIARAIGDLHTLGMDLAGLALVARIQGDHEESARLYAETVLVSSELRDQWVMPRALGGLAGAAVLVGAYERAAQLFGAMAAMRRRSGIGETARAFRTVFEQDETAARAILGDELFTASWAVGWTMPLDQVVAYALEDPAPTHSPDRSRNVSMFGGDISI
jgi:predicted ATPase/class 3 adenylate cyclase